MVKSGLTSIFLLMLGVCSGQVISMDANSSYLSNDGVGIQVWEDGVTMEGRALDGSAGDIVYDTQFRDEGFGVAGGRWDQLDYYENPVPRSEQFIIDFQGTVRMLQVTTGMMGLNEGGSGNSETGKWTAYNREGLMLGSGLLGPEYSALGYEVKESGSYGLYPINCDPGMPVALVVIEVTGFGHGEGGPTNASYGENNSDFNIAGISYERLTYDDEEPPENRAPVAVKDTFRLLEGTSITVAHMELLANDFDPDGDGIAFDTVYTIGSLDGELVKGATSITYTPDPGFVGLDIITYRITDGELLDFTNIVFVVEPEEINDQPADGDYVLMPRIAPAMTLQVDGLANRSSAVVDDKTCDDTEVWRLTAQGDAYELTNLAADKALEAWRPSPGNGDDATIYDDNNKNWQRWEFSNGGNDSWKIKGVYNPRFLSNQNGNAVVQDDNNGVNQQWLLIPISERNCGNGNTPPVAGPDAFTIEEDGTLDFRIDDILANDTDEEGDPLTVTDMVLANPNDGTLQSLGLTQVFTPAENLNGEVTLIYDLSDGQNPPVQGEITITVTPVNDRPFTGADGPYFTNKNTLIIIPASELLANDGDVDGDEISFFEAIAPENGTLEVFGEFIWFRPAPDYVGVEGLFAYTITDGNGAFATREVGIVVQDNRPPTPVRDSFQLTENTSITVDYADLLLNDSDPDGDNFFFDTIYTIGSLDGTLLKGASSFTYTPDPDFVGVDIITYRIEDENGSTGFTNIILTVLPEQVDGIELNGRYLIVSAIADASLQVNALKNRTSVVAEERPCDDTELWDFSYLGNGFHKMVNVAAGKAMEAWTRNPSNDDNVTIYSDNGFDWQQWEITNGGEGTFRFTGKYNPRMLTNNSGNAIVRNDLNGVNQQWILVPVEDSGCETQAEEVLLSASSIDLETGEWQECVTVIARDYDGGITDLASNGGRVGPASGRYEFQLDYDGETGLSEQLIMEFARNVGEVSFKVGNLEVNEYKGVASETGLWTAFNDEGQVVSTGEIDPRFGNNGGNGIYTFTVEGASITSVVLEATAYGNGAVDAGPGNNSDFSLMGVNFTPEVACASPRSNVLKNDDLTLSVFPNPAIDQLWLEANVSGQLSIFHVNGSLVVNKETLAPGRHPINISAMEAGVYVLRFNIEGTVKTTKFTVIK